VELGSLVICNAYRNPDYLADAHRTLDHISGGRAILGIGAGWFERDYDEYGYEFGTVGSRITALERALPRIEQRLARLNPPPVRDRIPLLIGGGGVKRTLRLAARHADIWHAFGSVDVFREKSAILDRHCADEGRDPAAIERSWAVGSGGDDPDALRAAGVSHLIISASGGPRGYDLGPLRELIAWRDALT
jgi:probable F420-dependent oxidoreductase